MSKSIINNTYFTGEIYLPHAKPGISNPVKDVESKLKNFIEEYVSECLMESLGSLLYYEFEDQLDSTKANGLKAGADAKWNDLLNGKEYINANGDDVVWKGIRWKTSSSGAYNRSFLAYYVYFYYESNDAITRAGAGNMKVRAANAVMDLSHSKSVKAWRKFIKLVQGTSSENPYFVKDGPFGGIGVDYYMQNNNLRDINLYQFINDMNELAEDTYADFTPKCWGNINQLGL